jgi:flavin-binding protein dodecin
VTPRGRPWLSRASVLNIRCVDVIGSTARVEGGEIVEYRVQLKLSFEYAEEA